MEEEKKERPKRAIRVAAVAVDNPELDKVRKKKDKSEPKLTAAQIKAAEKKRLKEEADEKKKRLKDEADEKKRLDKERKEAEKKRKEAEKERKKTEMISAGKSIKGKKSVVVAEKEIATKKKIAIPKPSPKCKKPKGYIDTETETEEDSNITKPSPRSKKPKGYKHEEEKPVKVPPKKITKKLFSDSEENESVPAVAASTKGKSKSKKGAGENLSQPSDIEGKAFESSEEDSAKSTEEESKTESKFHVLTKSLSSQKLSTTEKSKEGELEDVDSVLSRAASAKIDQISSEINTKLNALEIKIKNLPADTTSYLNE